MNGILDIPRLDPSDQKRLLIESAQVFAEACDGRVEEAQHIVQSNAEARPAASWTLHDTGLQLQCSMGARWAVNGFPQVTIGAKHLAALAATKLPPEVLSEVRSPWTSWLIEVPDGALWMTGAQGDPQPIRRIMAGWAPDTKWSFTAYCASGASVHRYGLSAEKMADENMSLENFNLDMFFPVEATTADFRAMVLCGRVVLGVALELASGAHVYRSPKGHAAPWRRRHKNEPDIACRTYQLRADVKIDCRDRVREYVLGGSRDMPELATQHLVRGHWKLQPHGPQGSLRKSVWIQPYWRGPEESPIAVRSHAIIAKDV
jgi:hypothetical protein